MLIDKSFIESEAQVQEDNEARELTVKMYRELLRQRRSLRKDLSRVEELEDKLFGAKDLEQLKMLNNSIGVRLGV